MVGRRLATCARAVLRDRDCRGASQQQCQQDARDGAGNGADTRPGVNLGGGLEYFYNRRGTITLEALYHAVSQVDTPLTTFKNGQFWTVGVGIKRYF